MFKRIFTIILLFILLISCSVNNNIKTNKIQFEDIINYYIKMTDKKNEYIIISSFKDFNDEKKYQIMIGIGRRDLCEIGYYKNDSIYKENETLIILTKYNILNNNFYKLKNKIEEEVCYKKNDSISYNYVTKEILTLRFDENYNFMNVYSSRYEDNYLDKEKTEELLKKLSLNSFHKENEKK